MPLFVGWTKETRTVLRMLRIPLLVAAASAVAACHSSTGHSMSTPPDVEGILRAAETAKWHPASIGRDSLQRLYASEMLTVEYGADPQGLASRSRVEPAMIGQLYDILNAAKFSLSEWRTLPLAADAILVSYRITDQATSWTAYASSVWIRRAGGWQTVFYQASRAKPAQ
jgi:hypothetical protein